MNTQTAIDWENYGYIKSSQYRLAVFRELADGPAQPTEIADANDLGITHISRALGRLKLRGVIELQVPEDQIHPRFYALTDDGHAILDVLQERDEL